MMSNKKHVHDFFGSATEPSLQPVAPSSAATAPCDHVENVEHATPASAARATLATFLEQLLSSVGMMQSTIQEFPGLVRVLQGPGADEATVQIDMGSKPYVAGDKPSLQRIVTLNVRLDHDYRLLGSGYYCIDCDLPQSDTVH